MGPIARVLLQMGVQVSGSDRQTSPATAALAELGARIFPTQAAENLLARDVHDTPHLVLISSAIAAENPERAAAHQLSIPVVKRVDFLPQLLAGRQTIAIAGTHGKTTTTGMIAHVLQQCGLAPGYIIGAEVPGLGNAAAGTSPWFVIEADEYDHMFLGLHPTVAVITNVEWDHPDCFPTADDFQQAFVRFLQQVSPDGQIVACADDSGVQQLLELAATAGVHRPVFTYGTNAAAQMRAGMTNPSLENLPISHNHAPCGTLNLQIPGLHNIRNALAALSVAQLCGIGCEQALAALATFQGSRRRFELVGEVAGVTVIDDYAHHPTEVAATLAAARSRYPHRTIHAVFQPHTYSRTRLLLHEMAASFTQADYALVTDIYAARETGDGTLHARDLVAQSDHPRIVYSGNLDQTTARLVQTVEPGAVVITLSAGDGNQVGRRLLEELSRRTHTTEQAP